jgi:hypothetical protein
VRRPARIRLPPSHRTECPEDTGRVAYSRLRTMLAAFGKLNVIEVNRVAIGSRDRDSTPSSGPSKVSLRYSRRSEELYGLGRTKPGRFGMLKRDSQRSIEAVPFARICRRPMRSTADNCRRVYTSKPALWPHGLRSGRPCSALHRLQLGLRLLRLRVVLSAV